MPEIDPGSSEPRQAAARPGRHAAQEPASEVSAPGGSGPGSPAPAGPRRQEKARGRNPFLLWLKEIATVVVIAVVLSFLIKTFLFRAFYIPSESMVSTLDVNDRIFVNLLVPEPFSLSRGDVVVFRDTKGWLSTAPSEEKGPFTWVQDGL